VYTKQKSEAKATGNRKPFHLTSNEPKVVKRPTKEGMLPRNLFPPPNSFPMFSDSKLVRLQRIYEMKEE
jgi:hypothetical protein